jgi:hypothetical protein
MSIGDTKSKIVSFRLSDGEYSAVEERSRKLCFPSVSQFARSLTVASDSPDAACAPLDIDINRLWRRLEALTGALEKIAADVKSVK